MTFDSFQVPLAVGRRTIGTGTMMLARSKDIYSVWWIRSKHLLPTLRVCGSLIPVSGVLVVNHLEGYDDAS